MTRSRDLTEGDGGVWEWASLAMLDAIDFAEELGMMRGDEAGRRRDAVRQLVSSYRSPLSDLSSGNQFAEAL